MFGFQATAGCWLVALQRCAPLAMAQRHACRRRRSCLCVQERMAFKCTKGPTPEIAGVQDASTRPLQQKHHRSLQVGQNLPEGWHLMSQCARGIRTRSQPSSRGCAYGLCSGNVKLCSMSTCSIPMIRTRQWQASSGVTLMVTAAPPPLPGGASRSTVVSPSGSATTLVDTAGHLSCAPPDTVNALRRRQQMLHPECQ